MVGAKPSTSKLIKEALMEGPKTIWEIYQYVKSKPTHYKKSHITYQTISNMLYVLKRLKLVRKLSRLEVERREITSTPKYTRIKPRYTKTYYEIVNAKSKAWNNPYKNMSKK